MVSLDTLDVPVLSFPSRVTMDTYAGMSAHSQCCAVAQLL